MKTMMDIYKLTQDEFLDCLLDCSLNGKGLVDFYLCSFIEAASLYRKSDQELPTAITLTDSIKFIVLKELLSDTNSQRFHLKDTMENNLIKQALNSHNLLNFIQPIAKSVVEAKTKPFKSLISKLTKNTWLGMNFLKLDVARLLSEDSSGLRERFEYLMDTRLSTDLTYDDVVLPIETASDFGKAVCVTSPYLLDHSALSIYLEQQITTNLEVNK